MYTFCTACTKPQNRSYRPFWSYLPTNPFQPPCYSLHICFSASCQCFCLPTSLFQPPCYSLYASLPAASDYVSLPAISNLRAIVLITCMLLCQLPVLLSPCQPFPTSMLLFICFSSSCKCFCLPAILFNLHATLYMLLYQLPVLLSPCQPFPTSILLFICFSVSCQWFCLSASLFQPPCYCPLYNLHICSSASCQCFSISRPAFSNIHATLSMLLCQLPVLLSPCQPSTLLHLCFSSSCQCSCIPASLSCSSIVCILPSFVHIVYCKVVFALCPVRSYL